MAPVGVAAMKGLTDEWLLGLLSCMVEDCFITTAQLLQVLACFDADEAKVEAVMKVGAESSGSVCVASAPG